MTRLTIIGEGPTEQAFCNKVLTPALIEKNIYPHNALILKSGGGIVTWGALKNDINNYLKHDQSVIVTTLIDYYGIEKKHLFPKWDEAHAIVDKNERISMLEQGMLEDIDEKLRYRFIPYIQLHEFEGLLFSNIDAFDNYFEKEKFKNYEYLKETVKVANPEMINDGKTTAPSKRLEQIIKSYKKPLHGSDLAEEIGLKTIREKCPRFNNWFESLLALEK